MSTFRITMVILFIVGFVLFLVGLLAVPAGAVEGNAPALQPSPRPTSALPTLRPTPALPTVGPATETPTSEPAEPAPQPDSPTPTPNPAVLPSTGGAPGGGWLLGLGGGFIMLGVSIAVLRRDRA